MDWRREVADKVVSILKHAGRGKLPETVEEYENVAERLGVTYLIEKTNNTEEGIVCDNVIVIKSSRFPKVVKKRSRHEFSEYLLGSEWDAPYCCPAGSMEQYRHEISCLTEKE